MKCTRCGSVRIVPQASIWEKQTGDLQAYIDAKPNARIFRERAHATLYARICADCGHTELFTNNAAALYEAYLRSQQS